MGVDSKTNRPQSTLSRRALFGYLLVVVLYGPAGAVGQQPDRPILRPAPEQLLPGTLYPHFEKGRETLLSGVGAGLFVTGALVSVERRFVPPEGLDLQQIGWMTDRRIVGNRSLDANDASDWTRGASMLFPLVLTLASLEPGQRWDGFRDRGFVYVETLLLSQGSTLVAKTMLGRPRPYTYLSEAQRPVDPAYDVSTDRTFYSMPSGHSSSAWTGAAIGMTEHLLSRPSSSWVERVGVGVVGGALGGATSALRVTAGQHFPSDVVAGAGIGIVTGVVVPLLHRGEQPLPSAEAWSQMFGGAVAGTLFGVLIGR